MKRLRTKNNPATLEKEEPGASPQRNILSESYN